MTLYNYKAGRLNLKQPAFIIWILIANCKLTIA